jgi:hypothetical protein
VNYYILPRPFKIVYISRLVIARARLWLFSLQTLLSRAPKVSPFGTGSFSVHPLGCTDLDRYDQGIPPGYYRYLQFAAFQLIRPMFLAFLLWSLHICSFCQGQAYSTPLNASLRSALDSANAASNPQYVARNMARKEVVFNMKSDREVVIVGYTLKQAIADGVLVEIFKNRWKDLSGGKPIVATDHIFREISLAGLVEIWNEFVEWRNHVMPALPEEDQLFHTGMNGKTVWVIEDGQAFTVLYPEDY